MICEKCGTQTDRAQIEHAQVEVRDGSQRHTAICFNCWEQIEPGQWIQLSGAEDEAGEEIRRLYWACDFCQGVWRYDGIRVLVREDQPPPRAEFLVCKECEQAQANSPLRLVPKAQVAQDEARPYQ